MPLDRFVPRLVKYEIKQSQMILELLICLSFMRICEGMCLVLSPLKIEFMQDQVFLILDLVKRLE